MLLKKGSRGTNVKYLQYGLRIMCINPGGLDGVFGEGTYNAVRKFQERFGLSADGIVGDGTWNKLKDQIRPIQSALNNHNYKLTVDGVAGDATYNAVRKIQRDHGLTDDGMVDNNTWKLLRATSGSGSHSSSGSSPSPKPTSDSNNLRRFVNIAEGELGVTERGNNFTKYGAWYGLDGNSWCAMFVSWCANQAGILNTFVPKYAKCSVGAQWYQSKGRYKKRQSSYVPKTGDVIFFTKNNNINHTGIVASCSNRTVYTIEGNCNNAVRRRNYSLDNHIIEGYGIN